MVPPSQRKTALLWHCGCCKHAEMLTCTEVPRKENTYEGIRMNETPNVRLGPREKQIVELLLQGCDNAEIASQLNMARRTVKAHFNRLFLRFGITGGIKRVKLATLLYRRQSCLQTSVMEAVSPANGSGESSNLLPKA